MPHQKSKKKSPTKAVDSYIHCPTLALQCLSYAHLSPLESMLINHIITNSMRFCETHYSRKWIKISPTTFGQERGFLRDKVSNALTKLQKYGLINEEEAEIMTEIGQRRGRKFSLVSQEKLELLHEALSTSNRDRSVPNTDTEHIEHLSFSVPNTDTERSQYGYGAFPIRIRSVLNTDTEHSKLVFNYNKLRTPKQSLNNIKEFLKKFQSFEFSFLEFYSIGTNSKRTRFEIEMNIASLIRQYGAFSTLASMFVNLFSKDVPMGNFEALSDYIKEEREFLKEKELMLKKQCVNVYNDAHEIWEKILFSGDNKDFQNFQENFRQNASVSLVKMETDESSVKNLFLYDSIHKDIIDSYITCNHNYERFEKEVMRHLNLYFMAKTLGIKSLNYVQADL